MSHSQDNQRDNYNSGYQQGQGHGQGKAQGLSIPVKNPANTMTSSPGYKPPKLGASYYPGGFDDFQMPELISPAPQRIMPEVPSNMQEGLAHLELEAREVQHTRMSSVSSISTMPGQYRDPPTPISCASPSFQPPPVPGPNGNAATYNNTNAALYQNVSDHVQGRRELRGIPTTSYTVKPSLFPKPNITGQRVPPSTEEKEAILESKRTEVLTSSNPEMQLAWAQDTLLWVDNAEQHRARLVDEYALKPEASKVETQLRTDAISIINYLADQNHPKALFLRATWHEFGKLGYPVDRKEAFRVYKIAAERGYTRAEYRLGTQYESTQDMAKAIKHYKTGASLGDAASNYRLGMMSLLGQHGQAQDYQLAVSKIRYAAEMADENAPQGAYVYGMLLAGELPKVTVPENILPNNIDQARHFIEKAAFLGFAKAQLKMGSAYELCQLGCDFNPTLSLHYNALAAYQGEPDADMAISKWFLCGYDGIFDKNEELAFTYSRRAARAGLPTAEFAMGYFYEIGMYAPCDLPQAKIWYHKAASHGNRDAEGRLESISQQKTLSKTDHEQIAIKRIRSQYGSQRGQRPEHLKEKKMPLPPTIEERVDMPDPDPARHSVSSPILMISPVESYPAARPKSTAPYPEETIYNPPRPKSTAPYPEEDIYPPVRPKSTAPYPEDDVQYGQINSSTYRTQQLRPQTGPVADRPSSAFGIRPTHLHTQDQRGHGYDRMAQVRPSSSMSNMAIVPDARGNNPASRHGAAAAGWDSQSPSNYRQASPYQNPLPAIDTGRQQPALNTHVGRNRLQKPAPNTSKPQPALPQQSTPDPGYPMTPIAPLNVNRKSPAPAPASQTRYETPSNYPQGVSSRPPPIQTHDARSTLPSNMVNTARRPERLDSMPQSASRTSHRPPLQQSSSAPSPSSHQQASSTSPSVSSQLPPRTSSATPSTPVALSQVNKPSREGPKTFDEMGIPAQRNENECIVM